MNTISRRHFAQLLGAGAAAAIARPALSLAKETGSVGSKVVRLSSNENPFGPSPTALRAMTDSFGLACRYPDEHDDLLLEALAKENGVAVNQILIGAGSGEILKICADAFTGPSHPNGGTLVVADPTFEAIAGHAKQGDAEVIKVPLTPSFTHDLEKMAASAKGGLVYICNPNNPTASITPKDQLRDFLASLPTQTMILVDEAYHHYVDSPDYESVIPLIKGHPNLIVARTFSKIYGMAGMRCGYCVAQPEAIERMKPLQLSSGVNIMALVAALASLKEADLVKNGRRLNTETRSYATRELEGLGYKPIASQANFIMVDLKRPVTPLLQAMKERNVQVGRLFPALPSHMRVTIGKKAEMEAFLTAFRHLIG